MTNKEKALELIGTFVSGDTAKAKELLAKDYIQHNLAYETVNCTHNLGHKIGGAVFLWVN